MRYLVDANVLCESARTSPHPGVVQWLADHDSELCVSVLSLGEILKGIHLMDQGKRRREIERWYQRLERWTEGRLLVIDAEVMTAWAALYAKHQRAGRKLPQLDSQLAATALHHQLSVVTRNTEDFPDEVPVLNPWEC